MSIRIWLPCLAAGALLTAPAHAAVSYVALGDSYTSAPLVPDASGSLVPYGTPLGCDRSGQNYPRLVAQATGMALTDVSCGGAVVANMTQPQFAGDGFNPPQLNAVGLGAQVVTISIGGNDFSLGEYVAVCAPLGAADPYGAPCKAVYTAGGTDQSVQNAAAVQTKVAAVVAQARQQAPGARILVVGYPDLLPQYATTSCYFNYGVTIAAGDVPYLDHVNQLLNQALANAAAANGVEFVDTYTSSVGHDMCEPSGVRWVEGFNPTDAGQVVTPVHPNLYGTRNAAAQLRAKLGY